MIRQADPKLAGLIAAAWDQCQSAALHQWRETLKNQYPVSADSSVMHEEREVSA